MRSWSCLGMILHRKERELTVAYPLDRPVIQIEMGNLEARRTGHARGVTNHCEAMVLRCDEHLIAPDVTYRMVPAAVAVRQFGSRSAVGEAHELMPETDAERRHPGIRELPNGPQCIANRSRITGAIGKKEAIGL